MSNIKTIILYIVFVLSCFMICTKVFIGKSESAKTMRFHTILQQVITNESTRCYVVEATATVERTNIGSRNRYTVSEVRLTIVKHDLGYARHVIVFESPADDSTKTFVGTTLLPVWDGHYIPDDKFILPSARLICDKNDLYLIYINNSNPCLYKFNDTKLGFAQINSYDNHHRKLLSKLFATSFSPNDAFWSYYLVRYASYFLNKEIKAIKTTDGIDTLELYKLYYDILHN